MRLVFGPQVCEWVQSHLPEYKIEAAQGIGLQHEGRIVCGVVYYNQRGHDIEMSIAATSPLWCLRGNLRAFFDYPFNQLGCARVTAIADESNARCRRMLKGLGFTHEGTHPKAMPNLNTAMTYGLLKEDCRWLKHPGM